MARQTFIHKQFQAATYQVISQANVIADEYSESGYCLTLRQLFYQFVARDLIPNTQRDYKRLGAIVSDARLAGLIDWDSIEDRTRTFLQMQTWANPKACISNAAKDYSEDPWLRQTERLEVWVEKDALIGVIEQSCDTWYVPFFSCRGYASQSSVYEASCRHLNYPTREVTVLHLADHDPSGLDMTADLGKRLAMFGSTAVVKRIALTQEQVFDFNLPPNPAKITDSRAAAYIERHGHNSWELDALSPPVLDDIISEAIIQHVDTDEFDAAIADEEANRQRLLAIARNLE